MPKKITTKDYVSNAKIAHGYKYDYTKTMYTKAHNKVTITCPEHGDFTIKACNHTNAKQGCPKCAKNQPYTTKEFIQRAQEIHGNIYDYSKTVYVRAHDEISITCPIHGDFAQKPYVHLQGHHCRECGTSTTAEKNKSNLNTWIYSQWEQAGNTSTAFDAFSVYVIECWSNEERFIKVGKTFTNVARRFRGNIPYDWRLLYQHQGSARYISELEQFVHNTLAPFTYLPTLSFGGSSECYVLSARKQINEIFNERTAGSS